MAIHSIIEDFAFGLVPIARLGQGDHRYLLICHNKGHWGFPKGHKEGDESDLVAAQREFEEETGVRKYRVFPKIRLTERYHFRKKKGQRVAKTVSYFLGLVALENSEQLPTVNIQVEEIRAYRWCTAAEARALIEFEGSLQILAQCETRLAEMDDALLQGEDDLSSP